MSMLPIPHLQACAPFTQYLSDEDIFQRRDFCQIVQNTPESSVVNLSTVPATSSAISLLADIDFSKPVSNSTIQSTVISVAQIPTLQSHLLFSTVSTPFMFRLAFAIQISATPSLNQSFKSDLDNRFF